MNPTRMSKVLETLLPLLSAERLERFDNVLSHRTRHITVVLENVFQSRNASAVMRSCDGFGIQDVHLIENINPWMANRSVSKGTPTWLTLHRYRAAHDPIDACVQRLRQRGYQIAVTTPHVNGHFVEDLPIDRPIALVMGTEWKGVSERMREVADHHVMIPMRGFAESLNISVAAAVALHELTRRMQQELARAVWTLSETERLSLREEWAVKSVRKGEAILRQAGVDWPKK